MRFQIPQPGETNLRTIVQAVRMLATGRSLAKGTISLAAGVTTTTVTAEWVGDTDTILLSPVTANAASAVATTYLSTVANGSFILTHANAGTTDRTFRWHSAGG